MVNECFFLCEICKNRLLRGPMGLGGGGASHSDGGIRNYFLGKRVFPRCGEMGV